MTEFTAVQYGMGEETFYGNDRNACTASIDHGINGTGFVIGTKEQIAGSSPLCGMGIPRKMKEGITWESDPFLTCNNDHAMPVTFGQELGMEFI